MAATLSASSAALFWVEQFATCCIRCTPGFCFDLDPVALAGAIDRVLAFGYDALDTALLTFSKQLLGIGEWLGIHDEARRELREKSLELRAPGNQGELPQIGAVQVQKVRGPAADVFRLYAPAMQRVKVGHAGCVRRDHLGIEDRGFRREERERVSNDAKPCSEICAIARMDADFLSLLVQLHTVAIELYLVQPIIRPWEGDRGARAGQG